MATVLTKYPSFRDCASRSPPVSPSVVDTIFITQNSSVTAGSFFVVSCRRCAKRLLGGSAAVLAGGSSAAKDMVDGFLSIGPHHLDTHAGDCGVLGPLRKARHGVQPTPEPRGLPGDKRAVQVGVRCS